MRLSGRSLQRLSLSAIAALTLLAWRFPSDAPVPAPGVTYRLKIVTSASAGGSSTGLTMVGRAHAIEGKSRVELDSTSTGPGAGPFGAGDLMLMTGDGVYLVHPQQKTYSDLIVDAISQMTSSGVPITLSSISVAMDTLQPETIDGRQTAHFRIRSTYTMNMMGQAITTVQTMEYWIAAIGFTVVTPMDDRGTLGAMGSMRELTEKMQDVYRLLPRGLAVRSVTKTSLGMQGTAIDSEQRAEVSDVREADVDPALVVLPADYRKVPLGG
jgi:hypothetical protein